jgi:hypothetical protein
MPLAHADTVELSINFLKLDLDVYNQQVWKFLLGMKSLFRALKWEYVYHKPTKSWVWARPPTANHPLEKYVAFRAVRVISEGHPAIHVLYVDTVMNNVLDDGTTVPFARNIYVLEFYLQVWQWQATNQEVQTPMHYPKTNMRVGVFNIVRDVLNLRADDKVMERLREMKSSLITTFFEGEK